MPANLRDFDWSIVREKWPLLLILACVIGYFMFRNDSTTGTGQERRGKNRKAAPPKPLEEPFATRKDIPHMLAKTPTTGRIAFAKLGNRLVETFPDHSLIIFGGARSRKTSCIAAPAIRTWKGSAVILSTKPDLYTQTVDAREPNGVAMFYPNGDVPAGVRLIGWNPLDEIEEAAVRGGPQLAWGAALNMARGLTNQAGREGGDLHFWMDLAQLALAPILLAAALSPTHGLPDVPRWVKEAQEEGGASLMEPLSILEGLDVPDQAVQNLRDLDAKELRARSSVLTTITTALMAYDYPSVLASATQPDRFRPWMLDDPRANLRTLYLLGSSMDQAALAPIFLGILDEIARYKYARADALMIRQDPNKRTPVVDATDRLAIVLDEAANSAPIPHLDQWASTGGSHGMVLVLVYQDMSQLRERLGADKAGTVVANCQSRIIAPSMADEATLNTIIGLVSTHDVVTKSSTNGQVTESVTSAPVLTMATLRQIPIGEGIVISGNDKPIRVTLLDQGYGQPPTTKTATERDLPYTAAGVYGSTDPNDQLAAKLAPADPS